MADKKPKGRIAPGSAFDRAGFVPAWGDERPLMHSQTSAHHAAAREARRASGDVRVRRLAAGSIHEDGAPRPGPGAKTGKAV